MSDVEQLQNRLIHLEEIFSHQENIVQQLNDSVIQLRTELARLETRFNDQEGRIRSLAEHQETVRDPLDEKPPHY